MHQKDQARAVDHRRTADNCLRADQGRLRPAGHVQGDQAAGERGQGQHPFLDPGQPGRGRDLPGIAYAAHLAAVDPPGVGLGFRCQVAAARRPDQVQERAAGQVDKGRRAILAHAGQVDAQPGGGGVGDGRAVRRPGHGLPAPHNRRLAGLLEVQHLPAQAVDGRDGQEGAGPGRVRDGGAVGHPAAIRRDAEIDHLLVGRGDGGGEAAAGLQAHHLPALDQDEQIGAQGRPLRGHEASRHEHHQHAGQQHNPGVHATQHDNPALSGSVTGLRLCFQYSANPDRCPEQMWPVRTRPAGQK